MKRTALLLLIALIVFACSDNLTENNPTPGDSNPNPTRTDINYPPITTSVVTSIIGRVVDDSGNPLVDALVRCESCEDNNSMSTERDGSFSFQDVKNNGEQAYLSVKLEGKFDSYRRMPLIEDRQNYTSVMLRDKTRAGTVSTSSGGAVSLNSGARLSLPAGGISTASGQAHTGDYEVYMSWIDPTDSALNECMMGDLSGIDLENNLTGLSTFGMLQVELETADGTALNLADGAQAELSFPVPAELKDIAPAKIPLWSYDETEGYWIEEGEATLVGDNYVGSVSHFSTWNVDAKIDPIDLCGQILLNTRETDVGLPFFEIRLSGESFTGVGGWLCEDGSFTFMNVPSGETLTLEVINYCGTVIKTIELGPYAEDTKIDPIVLTGISDVNEVFVQGNAITCDGAVVSNGNVQVKLGDRRLNFPIDDQGEFEFAVLLCAGSTATLNILNLDDFSTSTDIALTSLNNNYVLTDVTLCEENEEYFYMEWQDVISDPETQSYLATNPQEVWYQYVQGEYLFQFLYMAELEDDCWDTNGNGIGDPSEDVNSDGSFNSLDCLGGDSGEPVTFAFTQDIILNQVIQGVAEDGLRNDTSGGIILNGESYEFIFTEIGLLDAQGRPEIIAGNLNGELLPGFEIKCSFRLKPQ